MRSLVVIPTGTANTASVLAAFRRIGLRPALAAGADDVEAELVVLPGVGSFGAAGAALASGGWGEPLQARLASGRRSLEELFLEVIGEDERAG